jgi:hypothetical protein
VAFDAAVDADGLASSGSLTVTVPFTAGDSRADIARIFNNVGTAGAPLNLAGKTLSARFRLDTGTNATAYLIVKSTMNYVYAEGSGFALTAGVWTTATLNGTAPTLISSPGYDGSSIYEVDLEIRNGATCTGGSCPVTLHIDSVTYQ